MKVCFIGLGSIGKRHLKNISSIFKSTNETLEMHALRRKSSSSLPSDVESLITKSVYNYQDLDSHYDAIFITNPTDLHYQTIMDVQNLSDNFFIEKPLFNTLSYDISKISKDKTFYIAAPLRFTNVIQEVKKLIENLNIYSVRSISSSYLPDWRPGVDYTKVYSAHKDMGGGVCIDLIHEWDYLTYLFGFPENIYMFADKLSNLDIDSEDLAIYIAKYKDKMIELHLDYFGRKTQRSMELFTRDKVIFADICNSRITFSDSTPTMEFKEDPNDKYLREMQYFIDLCKHKCESINNIDHAISVLKLTKNRGE